MRWLYEPDMQTTRHDLYQTTLVRNTLRRRIAVVVRHSALGYRFHMDHLPLCCLPDLGHETDALSQAIGTAMVTRQGADHHIQAIVPSNHQVCGPHEGYAGERRPPRYYHLQRNSLCLPSRNPLQCQLP